MKIKNLRIMASALALTSLLNGCSISISRKDSPKESVEASITELKKDMTITEALDVLSGENTISFYFDKDISCPVENIDNTYKIKAGYLPYQIDKTYPSLGMFGLQKEDDYTIIDPGFDENMVPKTMEGYIGIKEEYAPILRLADYLNQAIADRDPNITCNLEKVTREDIIGPAYLLPKDCSLIYLGFNCQAYIIEENEKGCIYYINDEDILNYVAVKQKFAKAFNNSQLLINSLQRVYEEQNSNTLTK